MKIYGVRSLRVVLLVQVVVCLQLRVRLQGVQNEEQPRRHPVIRVIEETPARAESVVLWLLADPAELFVSWRGEDVHERRAFKHARRSGRCCVG